MIKTDKEKIAKAYSWQVQHSNPDNTGAFNVLAETSLMSAMNRPDVAHKRKRAKELLWDSVTNSYREHKLACKHGHQKAHQLINYLETHRRIAPWESLYLYSGIITFKNLKATVDENGERKILTADGHNAYKVIKNAEHKLKDWFSGDYNGRNKGQKRFSHNALMLLNAIETAFFKGIKDGREDIYNIHEHIIFALMNEALPIKAYTYQNGKRKAKYTVWQEVTNYLNENGFKGFTVSIRPLVNMKTQTTVVIDSTTTASDLAAVFATVTYDLKSGKIPQAKSWRDYYAYKDYGHKWGAVEAILNTIPREMVLSSVLSFKTKERKQNIVLMAIIRRALKLFHGFSLVVNDDDEKIWDSYLALSFRISHDKSPPIWESRLLLNIRKVF